MVENIATDANAEILDAILNDCVKPLRPLALRILYDQRDWEELEVAVALSIQRIVAGIHAAPVELSILDLYVVDRHNIIAKQTLLQAADAGVYKEPLAYTFDDTCAEEDAIMKRGVLAKLDERDAAARAEASMDVGTSSAGQVATI